VAPVVFGRSNIMQLWRLAFSQFQLYRSHTPSYLCERVDVYAGALAAALHVLIGF